MTTTITIPLKLISEQIRESVRTVLRSHGLVIAEHDHQYDGTHVITPDRFEQLLREFGNNAAQCLVALDAEPEPCCHPGCSGTISKLTCYVCAST